MSETSETTKVVVEGLLETLENRHRGFDEAAEKLAMDGREDLASQMRELSNQRARMVDELRDVVGSRAKTNRGSALGALHRSWTALRDALSGHDPYAVLAAAEEGEDQAVDEYRKAVRANLAEPVRGIIERQASGIKTAHDRIRALRDSNA